ncbi:MAG: HAD family phosphatase [Candidatus Saccharibacteria bacterium]
MLKAVIFDVDGTLIDTEKIQSDAFLNVLKKYGFHTTDLTEHGTVHVPGESTNETWNRLKERHDIPVEVEELTDHKRQAALDILQTDFKALPGVIKLFEDLRKHNIKMAVASSAQQNRLDYIIEGLGLSNYLDAVVSANDIKNVKPAPDAYLSAANKIGVEPSECIVIEDAEVGLLSAKAAGMKVVAVPNVYTKRMNFSGADLVVDSLEDISYNSLMAL